MSENGTTHVVVVGGGFAGVACARRLAGKKGVRVTVVDKNDYHQFQPLLYQVATAELTGGRHQVRPPQGLRRGRQRRHRDG
jgi:NADH dehydrogenase